MGKTLGYEFNPSKCQVIHVTRRQTPLQTKCYLHGCVLASVSSAKYLGVTLSEDLSWTNHINTITKKANQTLGFIKRNIRIHNKDLKSTAYRVCARIFFLSPPLSPIWYFLCHFLELCAKFRPFFLPQR